MANKYTKQFVDVQKAIDLYESGMTQTEVAKELGTTQKVIFHRFQEIGYKCRVAAKRNQFGEANHQWKGDDASKIAFHKRLDSRFGQPQFCVECGTTDPTKTYDWANLTGHYEDLNDYQRMCRSCHWKYDEKHKNFKGATGARRAVMPDA